MNVVDFSTVSKEQKDAHLEAIWDQVAKARMSALVWKKTTEKIARLPWWKRINRNSIQEMLEETFFEVIGPYGPDLDEYKKDFDSSKIDINKF